MPNSWQLQEAKNKLSEVVNFAISKGPQIITRRGEEAVVVLSMPDYKKISVVKTSLSEFFKKSPLHDVEISIDRSSDSGRKVKL